MNNPYSKMYDPKQFFSVTVNGQLMMAHLIVILENFIEELVQTNTDGIVVKVNSVFENIVIDLSERWAKHYGMKVAVTRIKKVIQKNVNNYIMVKEDGQVWRTGIYAEPSYLSGSLKVVTGALYEYQMNGVKPQEYIVDVFKNGNIEEFYYIHSISKDCEYVAQKMGREYKKINNTVCGVATNNKQYGGLYQVKKDLYSKLPGSPESFMNGTQAKLKDVDVSWYVEQVEKDVFF